MPDGEQPDGQGQCRAPTARAARGERYRDDEQRPGHDAPLAELRHHAPDEPALHVASTMPIHANM
jgi:hypothetical protein